MEELSYLVENVKMLTENPPGDEVINWYIKSALNYCMDYTNQDEAYVLNHLESILVSLTISGLNVRGAEGLVSQSYSGVSESYLQDVSPIILKALKCHRKVRR